MVWLRSWTRVLSRVAGAALLFAACSSGSEHPGSGSTFGGDGGRGGQASGGKSVIGVGATGPVGGEGGDGNANPLCGALSCDPDDRLACMDFKTLQQSVPEGGRGAEPEESGGGGSSSVEEGGSTGEGGRSGVAGSSFGGASEGDAGGEVGVGSGTDGGSAGNPSATPELACQVVGAGTECVRSGTGQLGAPCFDSAACAAGYACIREDAIGRCRPYCCRGEQSCAAVPRTYCAERSLRDDSGASEEQLVPVCVEADQCDLGQPPCEEEGDCECSPGTACQVVRSDGTTSCVPPGAGREGDACPCAYGYICSQADQRCRLLCRTNAAEVATGCGRCQASAGLPEGFGVCIGN